MRLFSASFCAQYLLISPNVQAQDVARDAVPHAKLYLATIVAIQHNPDIQKQYERLLKNGKTKMSTLGAAMRKLVQICFGVLKHQQPYRAQAV